MRSRGNTESPTKQDKVNQKKREKMRIRTKVCRLHEEIVRRKEEVCRAENRLKMWRKAAARPWWREMENEQIPQTRYHRRMKRQADYIKKH